MRNYILINTVGVVSGLQQDTEPRVCEPPRAPRDSSRLSKLTTETLMYQFSVVNVCQTNGSR